MADDVVDVAAIEARLPPPRALEYFYDVDGMSWGVREPFTGGAWAPLTFDTCGMPDGEVWARFAAHAPDDVRALCAEVRRVTVARDVAAREASDMARELLSIPAVWDALARRKTELIEKKIREEATAADLDELARLKRLTSLRLKMLAPLPLEEMRRAIRLTEASHGVVDGEDLRGEARASGADARGVQAFARQVSEGGNDDGR